MRGSVFIVVLLVVFGIVSCEPEVETPKRNLVLPEEPYEYMDYNIPDFFNLGSPNTIFPFGDTIDKHKATLGRVLFYETQLSKNNRFSCGTCHQQVNGFADNDVRPLGFENIVAGRNTQALVNTGMQVGFFWDLREELLDHMVLQPIANHIEMGVTDTSFMVQKISRIDYYPELFEKAYGSSHINSSRIGVALGQFVKSIVSMTTKYDQGRNSVANNIVPFPNFTEQENFGKRLFFSKFPCSTCHGGPNLEGNLTMPQNIGLDLHYSDPGLIGMLDGEVMNGFFKTPSMRNVLLTGPYMHDGRFKTIEEVIEFYNSGIQPHPQLSQTLRKHSDGGLFDLGPVITDENVPEGTVRQPLRMFMTGEEKDALVAFLKTLTDYELVTDPKFSDPFQTR